MTTVGAQPLSSGRWVSKITTSIMLPQKADRPGDKRSTIKHHTNTTTGSKKCRPDNSTARVSGSVSNLALGSSGGKGATLAAIFSSPK